MSVERSSPEAIARVLRDIAGGLKLAGESRFRIGAYERGADAIESFRGDLDRWIEEDRLREIPGIGEKLAALIAEIRATGSAKLVRALSGDLPEGALALARGPKLSRKAMVTLSAAGIRDLDALRDAARTGRLRTLPGFTEKTEARITRELSVSDERRGRMILRDARDLSEALVATIGKVRGADVALDVVGDVRRGVDVVDAIDLLASTDDGAEAVRDRFVRSRKLRAVDAAADGVSAARTVDGVLVRLHVVPRQARFAAMQRLTGSSAHNDAFDRFASRAHFAVDASGAWDTTKTPRERIALASEEAVYARAALEWVPPPLREGAGEIEAAARAGLLRLVEVADIRGMVHCHTDFSDGRDTVEAIARAAQDRGMKFITITDHSPTASYAHGVEIDRLERQWEAIARAQEKLSIRILRGTESDILKDGALDYPDSILEKLDVIIASIHNRYGLDRAAMTERVVRAMRHPLFKIWGHALGRLLLHRPPIDCDVEAILDAAAESRVAIEMSGDPHRLDMQPHWAKRARERGLRFVVSVDAHAIRDLDNVDLGVTMAQRAGLTASDVLNTLDADRFCDAVRPALLG